MENNKTYKYLGFQGISNQKLAYRITSYLGEGWYEVVFENEYITKAKSKEILAGNIKNKLHPSVYGIGYIGEGEFYCKRGCRDESVNQLEYEVWRGMIRRCYSDDNVSYVRYGGRGVKVCEEWHNFQNFAEWYTSQNSYGARWHLDKDLVDYKVKIYKPDVCTLVPPEVNSLFTGGFKTITYENEYSKWKAQIQKGEKCTNGNKRQSFLGYHKTKEQALEAFFKAKVTHVREVADKNKELLDERVYKNLTNPEWVREYILYLKNQNEEK